MIKPVPITKNLKEKCEVDGDMKKLIIAVSICVLVACLMPAIGAAGTGPSILLPGGYVEMQAVYGTDSWFDITISNIPNDYYDVKNDTYNGWCVQKSMDMTFNVTHQVKLISSYAENLNDFTDLPWNKINYIINHREGANRDSVQWAIWHYTDDKDVSGLPVSQALVDAADDNGVNYVPGTDDIIAIPLDGSETIQLAFIEIVVPEPSLQGKVWYDTNSDGIQNEATKRAGVTVKLYNSTNGLISETQTSTEGIYTFGTVQPGAYYLQFIKPTGGYVFTKKDIGGNTNVSDTTDSDADISTGKTILFNITGAETESITIWDAGVYIPASGGEPEVPEPEPIQNVIPTADCGNFGNPYRGYVNATITFNGSRSYDQDGRIITWRWTFGDGTEGTGEATTHNYSQIGTYNVTLLVTDDDFATDLDTTTVIITSGNNAPDAPVIGGPHTGIATIPYTFTFRAIDPDGDTLEYFIDWDDGSQNVSSAIASGVTLEIIHSYAAPGFYTIQAYVQDTYDESSDSTSMTVAIDVLMIGNHEYLIDMTGDGIYEKYHNNDTGVETTVNHRGDGTYLLDTDGDGQWDLQYDPVSGETQDYQDQPILQYALIGLVVLIIVFLLLFFLMRGRGRSKNQ
jgi:hypothetical protein